jgi:arylsulfatase A
MSKVHSKYHQHTIYIHLLISFLLVSFFTCTYFEKSDKKPNIVLIVADDLGYDDVTCYNPNSGIPTPNIDNLAKIGMRFTDAHSSASYDLPSRYAILTGRYGFRHDMLKLVHETYGSLVIDPLRLTLPVLMQRAGYSTYMSGKWNLGIRWNLKGANKDSINLGVPVLTGLNDFGFDQVFYTAGNNITDPPFFFLSNDRIYNLPEEYSDYALNDLPAKNTWVSSDWKADGVDKIFLNKAKNYINDHCENTPDQPFFMYFAPYAPRMSSSVPGFAKGKSDRGQRGDLCWFFDWMTGELVNTLKDNRIFEQTIVIITSDNGSQNIISGNKSRVDVLETNASFKGQKGEIYEGGHRVPFIIVWPNRIIPGRVSDEIICQTDIMATLGAIAGQKMTYFDAADSYNLSKLMLGKEYKKPLRNATVHHASPGLLALRAGKWKVVFSNQVYTNDDVLLTEKPGMVFNLEADIYEKNNLWQKRQDVVKKYQIVLDQYVIADRTAPVLDGIEKEEGIELDIPD